jgi:hypothetical protein
VIPTPDLASLARRAGEERWLSTRVFEIAGAWIATTPEHAAKGVFATLSAQHAWHAQLWHDRIPAIADITPDAVTAPANDETATFIAALARPDETVERLVGMARVLLPYLATTHAVQREAIDATLDGPTARVLDLVLRDEVDEWRRAEMVLRSSVDSAAAVGRAAAHQARLEEMLLSARAASPTGAAARGTARRS